MDREELEAEEMFAEYDKAMAVAQGELILAEPARLWHRLSDADIILAWLDTIEGK
jgi:hypothetical protein